MLDLRARALYRSPSGSYHLGHTVPRGFRYEVYSLLDDPPEGMPARFPPPVLPLAERERYLQLPALDPRIAELARSFSAGADDDLARARAIERHLRSDYGYTLQLPDREVADPLAHFLFVRRKGHCEYFASSMAVMLRSLGIPARLATGFQSGVYNPVSGLWLVRASDAHSWVEAWIPGHGWTTFDPTPADPNAGGLAILGRLALYLDAAGTFWQEWVMTYDVARVRRGQASVADATLLYQRMLHILNRRGYQKPPWFTPAEFAASLPSTPLGESVAEFTGTYNALRFGGHAEAAPRLSILLDRMERE